MQYRYSEEQLAQNNSVEQDETDYLLPILKAVLAIVSIVVACYVIYLGLMFLTPKYSPPVTDEVDSVAKYVKNIQAIELEKAELEKETFEYKERERAKLEKEALELEQRDLRIKERLEAHDKEKKEFDAKPKKYYDRWEIRRYTTVTGKNGIPRRLENTVQGNRRVQSIVVYGTEYEESFTISCHYSREITVERFGDSILSYNHKRCPVGFPRYYVSEDIAKDYLGFSD